MNYKVVVDAAKGGEETGNVGNGIVEKDYNLLISNYISNRLNDFGIPNIKTRTGDSFVSLDSRINTINSTYGFGSDVIVISNNLGSDSASGAEIIYALRNNSSLASKISNSLEEFGWTVNKYYQLRDENDTSLDARYLIRNTNNNQTIEIFYGSVNNESDAINLKNNYENYAEAVVKGIVNYVGKTYVPISEKDFYVVKSGDSLYSIANKYNISVNELKSYNNLSSNTLQIGQVLKIPTASYEMDENTYIVKSGDSLYSIANKYNISVNELKSYNNLSSNILQIGQVLKIPSLDVTYTVKSGDSLYSISKKYNITVNELKSYNNLSSNTLQIGQVLKIPS